MEEGKVNGALSVEALRGQRRRQIDTGLGGYIEVRALGYADLALHTGALLDVSSLAEAVKEKGPAELVNSPRGQAVLAAVEKVLLVGCVSPKLGTNPAEGAVVADLPIEVQLEAFAAILQLSGYSKKAGETVRPS